MPEYSHSNRLIAVAWKNAWRNNQFRLKTITGTFVFFSILLFFPVFFSMIEQRQGVLLYDRLLNFIPVADVSIPVFVIIWSMTALLVYRCVQEPSLFLISLSCIILIFLTRMITIMLVPLEPPLGLIPLQDPLSNFFYGSKGVFIRKDLFYSGHTALQFLMFLCLRKKADRVLAFFSTIAVAILVLVQHVHYTIDVCGAFVIMYPLYLWGKKIAAY